jgi:hypothetical protein
VKSVGWNKSSDGSNRSSNNAQDGRSSRSNSAWIVQHVVRRRLSVHQDQRRLKDNALRRHNSDRSNSDSNVQRRRNQNKSVLLKLSRHEAAAKARARSHNWATKRHKLRYKKHKCIPRHLCFFVLL